jgi:iron complex transport system permease protein
MGWKHLPNLSIQRFLTNKITWLYIISGGFVLSTALLGLFISSVNIPVSIILHIVSEKIIGLGWMNDVPKNIEMIIWEIRFPRVFLAFLVGMALALAGAAFQGLLRNPLADPYTIGVSSGAALGAVIVLFFGLTIPGLGLYTLSVFAIIGGCLALAIVYGMTRLSSRSLAIETIVLAGIIVSSFIGSFISLIIALSGEELNQIIYWLMGSVGMRGWSHVQLLFPFLLVGSILILLHHRELNALAFGEDSAGHLGVEVKRQKVLILSGASLLTGASVAVSGMIGFVGLVIPHLVRLVIGPNHRHLLPLSMMIGGAFLVSADLIARTLIAPKELPIGVITALIGAPVFALLLMREKVGKGLR